ncbi:hypothetical protein GCM10027341_34960 [Spirosoma knui]
MARSLAEELELKAYQHERAGEQTQTKVVYGQAIAERAKSGVFTLLSQGGLPLTKYLYHPYDDVVTQGDSLKAVGQSKLVEELYAKTLKQLEPGQAKSSSARRLQQQLYLIELANGRKNAEQRLTALTQQVLDEWGPYSDVYTSLLYEQIRYYDYSRNLPLLTESLNRMNSVLHKRQRNLAAFLLNDFEYDTFLALHQRYIDQLLSVCVKYQAEQPELITTIADYLLVSRNLQLNGQRILREHFIVKNVADMFVAFGMSVGIPYLKETVDKTPPDSKEHQEAVAEIASRQALIQQFNAKARRNALYIEWAKLKTGSDRNAFNEVESKLLDSIGRFIDQLIIPGPTAVIAKLQPDRAIVDFFSYRDEANPSNIQYGAIIYTGKRSVPSLVLLSSRTAIWQLIAQQKRELPTETYQLMNAINRLYTSTGLYELLWKPLMPAFDTIHHIDYLPIDLLNTVAFDALTASPKGKPLCEQFTMRRALTIPSVFADSVVIAPEKLPEKQVNADLWGGILYDTKAAKLPRNAKLPSEIIPLRGASITLTRGRYWNYLQGTKEEISKIKTLLKSFKKLHFDSYTKKKASEYTFKYRYFNLTHPHILHIATHGFYDDMRLEKPTNDINQLSSQSNEMMLKGALVLAGANTPPEADQEDGILTALEISRLNLNSKLVVLSACESGLGEQKSNEGVFGLQRAFKLAGAEYLLMTLWEIPDRETIDMMGFFYGNLSKGQSIETAFRNAQTSMKSSHSPFFWAGFVLLR